MVLKAPHSCQFEYKEMCDGASQSQSLTTQGERNEGDEFEQREVTLSEKTNKVRKTHMRRQNKQMEL